VHNIGDWVATHGFGLDLIKLDVDGAGDARSNGRHGR
jgi:hypothetical protein